MLNCITSIFIYFISLFINISKFSYFKRFEIISKINKFGIAQSWHESNI